MKRSDIADGHVLDLARRWREGVGEPGVVAALVAEGVPEKVAVAKVLHMVRRRLLDYGVSPYYAWHLTSRLPVSAPGQPGSDDHAGDD